MHYPKVSQRVGSPNRYFIEVSRWVPLTTKCLLLSQVLTLFSERSHQNRTSSKRFCTQKIQFLTQTSSDKQFYRHNHQEQDSRICICSIANNIDISVWTNVFVIQVKINAWMIFLMKINTNWIIKIINWMIQ